MYRSSEPTLSIVIPVYNSASSVRRLYEEIINSMKLLELSFEIIFVEDCGIDDSWNLIKEISQEDSRVSGIKLNKNFGQHAATICGINATRGAWVATIDDDLEQNPIHLSTMLAKALEGHDLVYGVFSGRTHLSWRNNASNLARWMLCKAIPNLNVSYTSLRVIKGDIARELVNFTSAHPFVDGYLSWLTNDFAIVTIPHEKRKHGKSNYTLRKLISHTLSIMVTFSTLPLRFASWLGVIFSLVGFSWLIAIVLVNLRAPVLVSGFVSTMAAIILFGGIQLVLLGVFGEYVARINFQVLRKPMFLVGEKTSGSRSE